KILIVAHHGSNRDRHFCIVPVTPLENGTGLPFSFVPGPREAGPFNTEGEPYELATCTVDASVRSGGSRRTVRSNPGSTCPGRRLWKADQDSGQEGLARRQPLSESSLYEGRNRWKCEPVTCHSRKNLIREG